MAEKHDQNPLPSKEELEKLKLKSEIEKINEEIAGSKKHMLRQKEFYTAVLPIVFGLFGLIFSYYSGYFDTKLEKLDVRKERLEIDIVHLKQDSIELYTQYERRNDSLFVKYELKKDSLQKAHDEELKKLKNETINGLIARHNDKMFQALVEAGDLALEGGNFDVARRKYSEALTIKSQAPRPAAQISYMQRVTNLQVSRLPTLDGTLHLTLRLGSMPNKSVDNNTVVNNVPLGNVEYSIGGYLVSTQPLGRCNFSGSGIINVKPDMKVYIAWTRTRNNCVAYLISR